MGMWEAILDELRSQFRAEQFNIWFRTMECSGLDDETIELRVPNEHYRNWIEVHFADTIREAVARVVGSERQLTFRVRSDGGELAATQGVLALPAGASDDVSRGANRRSSTNTNGRSTSGRSGTNTRSGSNGRGWSDGSSDGSGHPPSVELVDDTSLRLNPDYTFDNFVVGPSNQFAHAATSAVAERPAVGYNPLFIYGGVGVGKTHLMCAIGHAVRQSKGLRVAYLTSEQFVNELIVSIERKEMPAFRERYRTQCDLLLIDDIQFLAGKERTQEEFFHTFNALHNNGKQIVITSDKSPQEIPGLEERLQSRFSWGLTADIQRPELETRVAILNKKAAREGIRLPDQVGVYLANHINSNIRELEGALKRMLIQSKLTREPLSIDLARIVVEPFLHQRAAMLTPERIVKTVASYFNLKASDIRGRARVKQVAFPRQVAMYLARKHTGLSFPELGREFGKDHSTIIAAYQKVESLLLKDLAVKSDVDALERNILA